MSEADELENHKELVRRIVDDMFNNGRLHVSPEILDRLLLIAGTKTAAKREGPDGWAPFVKAIRDAVPDLNARIQNLIAEGDYVAFVARPTGPVRRTGKEAERASGIRSLVGSTVP